MFHINNTLFIVINNCGKYFTNLDDTCPSLCLLNSLTLSVFLWFTFTVEQYYTTNIQKNQLVQNDIRVAKKLQDEEEEEQAQKSALLRQASRQL